MSFVLRMRRRSGLVTRLARPDKSHCPASRQMSQESGIVTEHSMPRTHRELEYSTLFSWLKSRKNPELAALAAHLLAGSKRLARCLALIVIRTATRNEKYEFRTTIRNEKCKLQVPDGKAPVGPYGAHSDNCPNHTRRDHTAEQEDYVASRRGWRNSDSNDDICQS